MISNKLKKLLALDEDVRKNTINLNASENFTSNTVKNILSHLAYDNYSFPPYGGLIEGIWEFSGTNTYDIICEHINELCADMLATKEVDSRPKGGQAAEISVLLSLASAGDQVFYISEKNGGHVGLDFIANQCGIRLIPLLFDPRTHTLLIDENIETMKNTWKSNSKKTVMLCQSYLLKAQPYDQFSKAVKSQFPDCMMSCDVSHPLGLIIGHQFPNPLHCGFDILHASTHKTFPGPQKAIIATSTNTNVNVERLRFSVSPGLQSNCGTSEIFALAVALEEMKLFGKKYAEDVCAHAKHLAHELSSLGLQVVGEEFGFTDTHQVWILTGDEKSAWNAAAQLHKAAIRAFPSYLPFTNDAYGLRLGVNAMTRRGFGLDEFEQVARWIKRGLYNDNGHEKIKEEVSIVLDEFSLGQIKYSFDNIISSHSASEAIT